MKLIIVDTETSDLDPEKGAALLELAWVELVENDRQWKPTFFGEYYIQYSGVISPHAHATHHIPLYKLTKEGGALERGIGIKFFLEHAADATCVVAHNVAFDSKFLPEVTIPWICTMRSAKHVWPEAPGYSNQVLRYWLGIDPVDVDPMVELRHPHQARYDVATTTGILLRMLERFLPEQLLVMSHSPVRLKNIDFGKYQGMSFDQIPRDYLQWLNGRTNLNMDLRHTINTILGQ